jgi:hypothetical protein
MDIDQVALVEIGNRLVTLQLYIMLRSIICGQLTFMAVLAVASNMRLQNRQSVNKDSHGIIAYLVVGSLRIRPILWVTNPDLGNGEAKWPQGIGQYTK